jgi:signal transduction histidine kinase
VADRRLRALLVGEAPSPDELEERTLVMGLLFATGAVLVAAGIGLGLYDQGEPGPLAVIVAVAATVGVASLLLRRRAPAWTHPTVVAGGSVTVALVVLLAGPEGGGVAGIFLVYVSCFAFFYFTPVAAVLQWGLGAALHALALGAAGHPGATGLWVTVNGAALVAGGLVGSLGNRARRAAAVQRRLADQLQLADETKTAFLHAIGHELRTPMTTVVGFAQTLQHHGERITAEERRSLLDGVVAGTDRLRRSLDDLLHFGDLAGGMIRLETGPVDLADVVDRALLEASLRRDRVDVEVPSTTIDADEGKLVRAVANLLDNAAKYTPTTSRVEVSLERPTPDRVLLSVTDNGPGIPEEQRERVFEPFVRAHAGTAVEGTGIGLSLVRQVVRLHAGTCGVEEAPGGGARFCLDLPARQVDPAVGAAGPREGARPGGH